MSRVRRTAFPLWVEAIFSGARAAEKKITTNEPIRIARLVHHFWEATIQLTCLCAKVASSAIDPRKSASRP
jgi:hypothetical protein